MLFISCILSHSISDGKPNQFLNTQSQLCESAEADKSLLPSKAHKEAAGVAADASTSRTKSDNENKHSKLVTEGGEAKQMQVNTGDGGRISD